MPPLSGPKARLYPQRTHCTEISARMMKLCMIVPRAFFERTMPP